MRYHHEMEFTQGTTTFTHKDVELTTWYRVTGDLHPGGPLPLVVCHGGPGATHDYLLPLADLADSRPVIHYDQVGNGRSTHLPEHPEIFTVDLFVEELYHLIDHLGI
jgi:L-proline amide hydrolase